MEHKDKESSSQKPVIGTYSGLLQSTSVSVLTFSPHLSLAIPIEILNKISDKLASSVFCHCNINTQITSIQDGNF
jgi:hypothetical protein